MYIIRFYTRFLTPSNIWLCVLICKHIKIVSSAKRRANELGQVGVYNRTCGEDTFVQCVRVYLRIHDRIAVVKILTQDALYMRTVFNLKAREILKTIWLLFLWMYLKTHFSYMKHNTLSSIFVRQSKIVK